ncbi:MAG: DUF2142 domain-containing protein [Oscillospiraceae bacterium]|nr:DUF2142 domain-containing protein [Oscillospiraceae bacterium]
MKSFFSNPIVRFAFFAVVVITYLVVNVIIYQHSFDNKKKGLIATPEFSAGEILNVVTDDTVLQQSFMVHKPDFAGVAVRFSTYNTKVDNEIYFSISEEGMASPLIEWTASSFKIANNGYYYFDFEPIADSAGKKYSFMIKYKGVDPNRLVAPFYSSNRDEYKEGELLVNGAKIDGVIAHKQLFGDPLAQPLFNKGVWIYLFATLMMLIFAWRYRGNLVRIFFPCALILGLLFMFTTPMFRGQDETLHFYRAYEVSLGHSTSDFSNGIGGRMLPASLQKITLPDVTNFDYSDTAKGLKQELEPDKVRFINFPNSALYSPIVYYPQAFGIWLARTLGFGPMIMAFFGRFFNLLVWALLMMLALQILYFGKRMVFLLALTPMSLYTVASLSCDGITNALAFLFISYVMYLAFGKEKRISAIQIAFLLLLSAGISLSKIVYMPLCLIMFIIPISKFGSKRRWGASILSLIFVSVFLNISWLMTASKFLVTNVMPGVNAGMQLDYILTHPLKFIGTIFYSLSLQLNFYIQSFFGGSLGWFDISVHTWIVVALTLGLVFLAMCDNKYSIQLEVKRKMLLLGVFLLIGLLIFASIYIQYNRVGANVFEGIQGRYFMPIALLLLYQLNNIKTRTEFSGKSLNFALASGIILLQFPVLLTILVHHI